MKPHPRIRKTIKWGGAAVTVLLVVVWIGSGWRTIDYRAANGRSWSITSGSIIYWRFDIPKGRNSPSARWHLHPKPFHLEWNARLCDPDESHQGTAISLWQIVLAAIAAASLPWRPELLAWLLARRRAKLNLCAKCGYDRTGILKDAKCPECGTAPASV